ncbi:MAG: permease-like cell division protein FtsX [Candidatus Firestonebacteria bacterium]
MNKIKEALNMLVKNKYRTAIVAVGVGLNLLLLSLLVQSGRNLSSFLDNLNKNVRVIAYVPDSIKQPEIDSLLEKVKSLKGVKNCVYLPKEKALEEVINEPEIQSYLDSVKENPLPNTVRIEVSKGCDKPAFLKELAETVKNLPGVSEISYKQQETERLLAIIYSTKSLALVIFGTAAIALLFGSWALIRGFAGQQKQENHKDSIKSKQEIGGIIAVEFVLIGLVSGVFAAAALVVIEKLAGPALDTLWSGSWLYAGILLPLLTVGVGGVVGYIGSLFGPTKSS